MSRKSSSKSLLPDFISEAHLVGGFLREDPYRDRGLAGEEGIVSLCRREGIATNLHYRWSKEFLEAGKERLLLLR
jgi:hypothetical protein